MNKSLFLFLLLVCTLFVSPSFAQSGNDATPDQYWDPLLKAITDNDVLKVSDFLSAGANSNAVKITDDVPMSPLFAAIMLDRLEILKLLTANGADFDLSQYDAVPLIYVAGNRSVEVLKFVIDQGVDINAPMQRNGKTALILASSSGKIDNVLLLLSNGADISLTDNHDMNALHWAAGYGHVNIVQVLLDSGANIDARTGFGETPLIFAGKGKAREMGDYLISKGSSASAVDNSGKSYLDYLNVIRDRYWIIKVQVPSFICYFWYDCVDRILVRYKDQAQDLKGIAEMDRANWRIMTSWRLDDLVESRNPLYVVISQRLSNAVTDIILSNQNSKVEITANGTKSYGSWELYDKVDDYK